MGASIRLKATRLATVAALALPALLAAGQVKAPSGGQIDTVAVEGKIEEVSPQGTSLSVRTTDGTTQLFRLLEKTFVHGADPNDELIGLKPGTPVVIHYSGTGTAATVQEVDRIDGRGLTITEGVVSSINRDRGEITVRYDNKTSETFKLTNRAARDSGLTSGEHTRVIVYYTNKRGVKEVHYFRKK